MAKNPKSEQPEAGQGDAAAPEVAGNAPKAKPEALQPVNVTYVPGPEDPPKVRWGGKVFHANLPLPVDSPVLLAKAKDNPWFHVGDGPVPVVRAKAMGTPRTAEQYRAHVVAWLKAMLGTQELDARWAAEETLRMSCGVTPEDLDYLATLLLSKKGELAKAEAAEE